MWSLSQRYHTSIRILATLNGIANPDRIRSGQTLTLPSQPATVRDQARDNFKARVETGGEQPKRNNKTGDAVDQKPRVAQDERSATLDVSIATSGDASTVTVETGPQDNGAGPVSSEEPQATNNPVPATADVTPPQEAKALNVSKEDFDLLARVIYAEARGEDFEGKVAVGAVVLNRLRDPHFPKTIREIIYQPAQFTAVSDKQIQLYPDAEAYQAAEAALSGVDPTGGALYYFNPRIATDRWIKSRPVVKKIGNHTFSI